MNAWSAQFLDCGVILQTNEKPAGRAEADVTVQTVNQLEEDPSGREWALTKHKYSHQERKRLRVCSSWLQPTPYLPYLTVYKKYIEHNAAVLLK